MAEEKIVTEVAGRVCAIPAEPGAKIGAGEDVVLVEAMKMEIGASSEKGGIVKSILVKPDEMVEEGQVVAIVESSLASRTRQPHPRTPKGGPGSRGRCACSAD